MFNIIEEYNSNATFNIFSKEKSSFYTNDGTLKHREKINVLNNLSFCNFDKFNTIDEFVQYIDTVATNDIVKKYKDGQYEIKGYIFEIFALTFLNYFSTFNVIEKNNKVAPIYTIKYCISTPKNHKDYGIDLLCRITNNKGDSKNAVIQVKYRKNKEAVLKAEIMDKLFSQGVFNNFIDAFNTENNKNDKTLILFTDVDFNTYRPTFEKHCLYNNTLIIDCNTINLVINNSDYWNYFKEYVKNL